MLPTDILKQPALIRLMLVLALLIFPAIAWVDYHQGYRFSALVEVTASALLFGLATFIPRLGTRRAGQMALIVMFLLAAVGSVEKLGSTPNFAWFTVVPFLYIFLGSIRLGGILTAAHLAFISACYLFFPPPETSERFFTAWVPERSEASFAFTTS